MASCVTTGMHALVDIAAGVLVAEVALRRERIWRLMCGAAEWLASSWREWRVGSLRIINHGGYPAAGTFLGVGLVGFLVGRECWLSVVIISAAALVTAAIWAQVVEGGRVSLRPFGYYGGVIGGGIGGALTGLLGHDAWAPLAAFAVAAPIIQAVGRARCLVQGCCHGRQCSPERGIRYVHPRSRVVRLAGLEGVPVYPTQLHSALWNLGCCAVLLRLWFTDVPLTFVAGLYLMLNGVGRFVEEGYRGEPQTPRFGGLVLYQWMALGSLLAGAGLTCVPGISPPAVAGLDSRMLWLALAVALIVGCAMGVDVPGSGKRFSRLV